MSEEMWDSLGICVFASLREILTLDVQVFSVIPAKAGIQTLFQPPVDSGSPLRYARNDGYPKTWSQKNLIIELQLLFYFLINLSGFAGITFQVLGPSIKCS